MSFVYLIANAKEADPDHVKIGASRAPRRRRSEMQVSAPERLVIVASWRVASMFDHEKFFHDAFAPWRSRGEWFRIPRNLARETIDAFLAGERDFFECGLEYLRREDNDEFAENVREMIDLNRERVKRINTWDLLYGRA